MNKLFKICCCYTQLVKDSAKPSESPCDEAHEGTHNVVSLNRQDVDVLMYTLCHFIVVFPLCTFTIVECLDDAVYTHTCENTGMKIPWVGLWHLKRLIFTRKERDT